MKNYVHLGGAEMDNSLQDLRNSSYHAHPQILVRTLLEAEPLRDYLVSRALFPGFGVLWRWGGAFSHPTSKAGEKRPGDEVDYAKRAATPRGFKLICTRSSRGAATQAINPATNRLSIFTIASNKIRVNPVFDHWRHLEKFARREIEPQCVLQLFLGSLLGTRRWPIAHFRYMKIPTWLRGFRVKIANFSTLHCLVIPKRDLSTKKTKPNVEKWPESLGFMFEF